jgi:hypothetical protein
MSKMNLPIRVRPVKLAPAGLTARYGHSEICRYPRPRSPGLADRGIWSRSPRYVVSLICRLKSDIPRAHPVASGLFAMA